MKISINLLPPETIAEDLKKAKFYKIQSIGVAIILVLVFLTSLTLALQVLQSRNINMVQAQVTQSEQRINALKDTQASLVILKDRLNVIDKYLGVSSKQAALYKLMDKIIPSSIIISAMTVDKNGTVSLMALVQDSYSLDRLIGDMMDKETNEGKISQLGIETLSRGRDGLYRISFKIVQ